MTFEKNYKLHSKEYIFSNNEILKNKRENIFSKLISKNFDQKNNESLKNISFSDLSVFEYNYNYSNKPSLDHDNNGNYKINIVENLRLIKKIFNPMVNLIFYTYNFVKVFISIY